MFNIVRRQLQWGGETLTLDVADLDEAIAFVADHEGWGNLYSLGPDGTGLQQITRESACDRPTWSPAPSTC